MENLNRLLYQAVSIIIFCLAVSLLYLNFKNYHRLLNSMDISVKESMVYEGSKTNNLNQVSKGQLIASLLDQLEYNIIMNGYVIKRSEHDMDKIQSYPINSEWYIKEYVYDFDGMIIAVTYTSIND